MATARAKDLEAEALKAENTAQAASEARDSLEATIKAAELYMQALRITDNPDQKKYLDSKCKDLVKRAEVIKQSNGQTADKTPTRPPKPEIRNRPRKLREPISSRELTKSEQILLWKGSDLNGFKFPPWGGPPAPSEFDLKEQDGRFLDLPELQLSAEQLEIFDGWKRPDEVCARINSDNSDNVDPTTNVPTMRPSKKFDLIQDLTSDCSVVASLCAGTSRAERGHSKILSSIVYPYDHNIQYPILSANGKYVFRLHFNGCFRKVVIDDRLPSSKTSRALHVIDRNNPGLLWPALVEKAYLKVRGGYDFPGSNSGTDIWVLTNWIPEQIFLHQEDVISDELWKRVFNAFSYGDVLLTIGTGKLSRKEERQTGLAGEHDYAILDLKEEEYRRMVLVKNPWSEGSVWKGFQRTPNPSPDDAESKSDQNEEELAPGSFWINFNHIFQYFESLYLNWNPGLFSCRQDVHFNWDLSQLSSVPSCFARNPQYSLKTSEGGSVWLLLSRHFKTGDYVHSAGQGGPPTIIRSEPGFISLYAFNKQGERVFLSDSAIHRGPFVDSPNTLLRFEMPASSTYTIVVSGQSLPRSSFTFSLSAFSLHPLVLSPAKDRYTHSTDITAAWTLSTAGGNADSPLYTSNPQFSLTIPRFQFPSRAVVLAILLETTNPELPVHIKLFRTNPSTRVATVRTRDIYADSGEYRRGCALLSHNDLEPGTYAIICSTFHKAQLAHFILRAFTSTPFTLAPLPAEGAGRLRLRPEPAIFPIEVERVLAPLTPKRLTRLFIVATHSPSPQQATGQQRASPPSPLKLSIELGQGPYKEVLAVSNDDEFSDAVTGVRIEDLDLTPELLSQGGIWLVLERMGSSGSESVDVELLSEEVVGLGRWGTGSG